MLLSFLFIVIAGVVLRRWMPGGMEAEQLRRAINTLVLHIFLPALCIRTLSTARIDIDTILVPAAAAITTLVSLVLAVGVYAVLGRRLGLSGPEEGVLVIAATFGNVTYLGLPVLTSLYGPEAAKYALFYDLLAVTPILWLVGAPLAARYGGGVRPTPKESLMAIVTLPPVWGIATGLILNVGRVPLPTALVRSLEMLGGLVVPLMIFSIGLSLTLPRVRHVFAIVPAVFLKLAVVPLVSGGAAALIGVRSTALAACLLEGAMPTMVLSLLIAARFRLDVALAAFIIVVTTMISFGTLQIAVNLTSQFIR